MDCATSLLLQTITRVLAFAILSATALNAKNASSKLFNKLDGTAAFSINLLPNLSTNESISRITDMRHCSDGGLFLGGVVEALDRDPKIQTFAQDEPGDRLGAQDMFLVKLAPNGTLTWARRFGSHGTDDLHALAVDAANNVYVGGSIGRAMGDQSAGGILIKYAVNGTREWVKNVGDDAVGDTVEALAMNDNSSEVIAAGTIGPQSSLHTDETKMGVSAVMVVRFASGDGTKRGISVGTVFDSEVGVVGTGLTVRIANGSGSCFVVGWARATSGVTQTYNSAVYSFDYPSLREMSKREVFTQTRDMLSKSAISNNEESLYAVGTNFISTYAEMDISVRQFEAKGLKEGWSTTIGSKPFADQASVEEGGASEYGRDIAVDKFGNVYVLGEASGAIQNTSIQETLKNKRAVLMVYAPDGSWVYTAQSEMAEEMGGVRMIVGDGKVIVGGWSLDQESMLEKVWVSGVEIPQEVYRMNGEELEADIYEGGEGESGQDREEDSDTGSGSGIANVGLIAGTAGGVVATVVVGVGLVVVVVVRRRGGRGAQAAQV